MAILTHKTELHSGADALTMTKLIDIKDYPALREGREAVETTTLSDMAQTFIAGIRTSAGKLDFTANYVEADWDAAEARIDTDTYFKLVFSDGSSFEWQGEFDLSIAEGGQNAPVEMIVSVYPSTEIVKSA
jgi:hypothetical protein